MKKTRWIQVFLVGDSTCEINGLLVEENREKGWYHVAYKDEAGDEVYYTSFPNEQVRMVRYSYEI